MSTQDVLVVYQPGQASSLIAIVVFAVLSILAIAFVPLRCTWVYLRAIVFRRKFKEDPAACPYPEQRFFFSTQLGAYTASMLCGNLLNSLALAFNAEWVRRSAVERDTLCMAQGVLGQVGNIATAFFTGAVAVHSFNSLVLHNKLPKWACTAVIVSGWVTAVVVGVVPAMVSSMDGPVFSYDGLACGVAWKSAVAQIILLLVPTFLSALCSVVFYVLIFLVLRGALVFQDGFKLHFEPEVRRSVLSANGAPLGYQQFMATVVKSMLCVPVVYLTLLLWYIIVVLLQASGMTVSFGFKVFASAMRAMLGLANALILFNTLRILSPHLNCPSESSKAKREADMESFYVPSKSPPVLSPEKIPPVPRLTLSTPSSASSDRSDPGLVKVPPVTIPRPASAALTVSSVSTNTGLQRGTGATLPSSPRAAMPTQPPSFAYALRAPEPARQKVAHGFLRDSARWSIGSQVNVPRPGLPSPPRRPARPMMSPRMRDIPPAGASSFESRTPSVASTSGIGSLVHSQKKPSAPLTKKVTFTMPRSTASQEVARVASPVPNIPRSPAGPSAGFRASPAFARTVGETARPLSPVSHARSPTPRAHREEMVIGASPRSKPEALPSPAWAALVAAAATSGAPLPPASPQALASRRRSQSIELPPALRPRVRTPMSARAPSPSKELYATHAVQSAKPSLYSTPSVVVRDSPRTSRTSVVSRPDLLPTTSRTSSEQPYGYF